MKHSIRTTTITLALLSIWGLAKTRNHPNAPQPILAQNLESPSSCYTQAGKPDSLTFSRINKMLEKLLRDEHLRGGASVALSKNGRMVWSSSIGYADLGDSIPMQPSNIMRVASVSKLITAIAVMKLVEQGKISLHQRIFGPVGVLNYDEYLYYRDPRMGDVTVYQLLNHSGGWTARWGDPMFMPASIAQHMGKDLPVDMSDIISFMQDKRMHFSPGSASVYSNFGYALLGEVVAKAARMPYEDYVRTEILAPIGIYDMQLGHSHLNHLLPNEAKYYEADTSSVVIDYETGEMINGRAYGATDIQTLGSAGGWVASAPDLLKLVLSVDGFAEVPDQLSEATIDTMTHHELYFDPLGWRATDGENWYRSGTLAATSAIIGRLESNICYAIILNCANYRGPQLAMHLKHLMNKEIKKIEQWPTYDLLDDDEQWQSYKHQKRHD